MDFSSLKDGVSWLKDSALGFWLGLPNPANNPEDDVWSDFELFSGEWRTIQNRKEWYESPNVPNIYADHKYIFDKNMEMNKPEEIYYKQNVDSNEFESKMDCDEDLPSGWGSMRISTHLTTKTPPSGENDFCMIQYVVETKLRYEMPHGIRFLPRILAHPLNDMFRVFFYQFFAEERVEYDGEYAIERTREYFDYIRRYHGEEPTQTRTHQNEFAPTTEEGPFFQ
jgi:hypothetical protein